MKRKLILKCNMALGDAVLLSAAVRDLHRTYPERFVTDVRTPYPDLWHYNPFIKRLLETDPSTEIIKCKYPLVEESNRLPYHAIHGFKEWLNQKLGLNIQLTDFKGAIYLSRLEKEAPSLIQQFTGRNIPFWIIAAGGKYDHTIKWWDSARYQEVVDHFRGKIQFVQIGAVGDHHPRLCGVIDLRGYTKLRELIQLMYHAQGVLCGVTSLMHLAAAVETRRGQPPHRGCVVVAGAREAAHWEAYPDHQFIHTNGSLPCCRNGGCWRARTVPLGDGEIYDRSSLLCKNVAGDLPRCMDLITSGDVIRRIEIYFEGGGLKYLTPAQYRAAQIVVDRSPKYSYDTVLTPYTANRESEKLIKEIPPYAGTYSGRGIVICGGGFKYFPPAWVCINMLRKLGCKLPIQLWYLKTEEMSAEMRDLLTPLGVECIDASKVREEHPMRILGGWELKPFAIIHARFREVLFLDADNLPLVDPEFLFETPEFRRTGAIFWPDIRRCKRSQEIWRIAGVPFRPGPEFESGQIVIDKERCWRPLSLALWYNEHSDFFYQHILGDKETFHLAFRKLGQPFAMPQKRVHRLTATMCQHDFHGRRIFQHRNLDKWNIWLQNRKIKGFEREQECRDLIRELRAKWDGGVESWLKRLRYPSVPMPKLSSPPSIAAVMISDPERGYLADTIDSLRATDWGDRPVHVVSKSRTRHFGKIVNEKTYNALRDGLRLGADYVLFLEDDLVFNRFIRHNLESWAPLRNGEITLASLYNPSLGAQAVDANNDCSFIDPTHAWGAQALVLSRLTVKFLLKHWDALEGFPDTKIPRLAERLGRPILYHVPSLVQHVGGVSIWGGGFHQAPDFSVSWRRRPSD